MADKRKLQGDIERCLKKVTEGVETFEDIWKKIQNTNSQNQKEKYEADLKKEIKKLQRLRDQIKGWLASNDVKDKSSLQENRKLIETQMERFKAVERETKIKAYSKEGLGAIQKVDPAQKEKDKISIWLTDSIDALTIQVDHYESEIEVLSAGTKKKKNQKEKQNRIEELKKWLDKHRYHMHQLEALLRMLDNGTIDVCQIKKIQDDIKHYIESSQEPDFHENEYIYDDLDLEDFEEFLRKQRAVSSSEADGKMGPDEESSATGPTSSNVSTSTSSSSPLCNLGTTNQAKESENKVLKKPVAVKPNISNSSGATSCSLNSKPVSSTSSSSSGSNSSSSQAASLPPEIPNTFVDPAPAAGHAAYESQFAPSLRKSPNTTLPISRAQENCWFANSEKTEKMSYSNVSPENTADTLTNISCSSTATHLSQVQNCATTVTSLNAHVSENNQHLLRNIQCLPVETPADNTRIEQMLNITEEPQSSPEEVETNNVSSASIDRDFPELPSSTVPLNSEPRSVKPNDSSVPPMNFFPSHSMPNGRLESRHQTPVHVPADIGGRMMPPPTIGLSGCFRRLNDVRNVPPIIGVYPVGSNTVAEETRAQLRILESASCRLPYVSDSCRVRSSLSRSPCHVPPHYKLNFANCDTFEFFQHLSTETLFFIFYYMEGSKAQYLAAKTLKKQSWRFHTRLMLWFQRHEEPKTITDEYEQGTYIYFDYEKWSQRKKDGFTFEYRYLEDIDLN